ncbi:hypothetical protein AAFF_G00190200 [Aldrovandia affinis]|uniref:Uncharacterized protein n=1 Tax=Aldrovandia affinis TaxID=143900 RepID=A0AAD7W740_9TELE|nr:hypothetical protein AAFF_G00190200 [Aldrovandia affinis]
MWDRLDSLILTKACHSILQATGPEGEINAAASRERYHTHCAGKDSRGYKNKLDPDVSQPQARAFPFSSVDDLGVIRDLYRYNPLLPPGVLPLRSCNTATYVASMLQGTIGQMRGKELYYSTVWEQKAREFSTAYRIQVLGCLPVTVARDDVTCPATFFIVKSGTTLLGMDLITGLKLHFEGNTVLALFSACSSCCTCDAPVHRLLTSRCPGLR